MTRCSRIAELENELFDAQVSAEAVGWIRDAAKRVTGGNCAFVDDDLAILVRLAENAAAAGLLEGVGSRAIRVGIIAQVKARP